MFQHYKWLDHSPDRAADGFKARDVPFLVGNGNASVIELTRDYPEPGRQAVNHESELTVYIIQGNGILELEEDNIPFAWGSLIKIPPEKAYSWRLKTGVQMLVIGNPPWTPEQHQLVPE
jgi:hypothetical protein